MEIKVEKLSDQELQNKEVFSWGIWEKEISQFPWEYDSTEQCYLLTGQVEVTTDSGEKVTFGQGDFVTFPQGLSCTWDIKKPVKKHYKFIEN